MKLEKNIIDSQQGSALLGIIIAIVIVAGLGTAILNITNTSSFIQLGSVDSFNAFFLAESGRNYALTYIEPEMTPSGDPDIPVALLNNKTFTLPNSAGQFQIALSYNSCTSGGECQYVLVSTGIPNSTTKRSITYTIDP